MYVIVDFESAGYAIISLENIIATNQGLIVKYKVLQ